MLAHHLHLCTLTHSCRCSALQGQVKASGDLHHQLAGRLDELQSTGLKAQEEKFAQ